MGLCACAQSVNDMPAIQDGPPPGGYPAIRFARRIPNTGPSGFTLFAVSAAVMAYGFYKVRLPRRVRGLNSAWHPAVAWSACPACLAVSLVCWHKERLASVSLRLSGFTRKTTSYRQLSAPGGRVRTAYFSKWVLEEVPRAVQAGKGC